MVDRRVFIVVCFLLLFTTAAHRKLECRCGRERPRPMLKMVGGAPTRPHQYPWAVVILVRMAYVGVGTLINNHYVLTAAHVVERSIPSYVNLALGIHNRVTMANGTIMNVAKITLHPEFHPEKLHNDIGLIKTASTIAIITDHISPICLPTHGFPANRYAMTLVGWGSKRYKSSPTRVLNSAVLNILPWNQCKQNPVYPMIKNAGVEPDTFICAMNARRDACQGDSGAPLMYYNKGKQIIIGIVSFGHKCGEPGYAGLYTNVTMYLDWIMKETEDAQYCKE